MEYEIQGGAFPIVICTLQKGETMKNETGAMSFMTSGMKTETSTGGGLLKGLGRALSGDTIFLNFFTAQEDNQKIGFSSCTPGRIFPVKLDGTNSIIGQKNAFLAAEEGVDVDMYFRNSSGSWGGKGVSFLDTSQPGHALGVAYLITREQFEHVACQENGGCPPEYSSWYNTKVSLGSLDGCEAFTITNDSVTNFNDPSEEYLKTLHRGIAEHYPEMHNEEIDRYLTNCIR